MFHVSLVLLTPFSHKVLTLCIGVLSEFDPSVSLMVDHSLFFLLGGSQTTSEELSKLAFLKYVLSSSIGILLLSLLGLIYLVLV
jgi:hypothetical protein